MFNVHFKVVPAEHGDTIQVLDPNVHLGQDLTKVFDRQKAVGRVGLQAISYLRLIRSRAEKFHSKRRAGNLTFIIGT